MSLPCPAGPPCGLQWLRGPYQQVQDPGSERLKAGEAQPQVLEQADQNFDPGGAMNEWLAHCALMSQWHAGRKGRGSSR